MSAARPGFGALLQQFIGSFSFRQLLTIWFEEWIGTVLRPVPSMTGFVLRYLFYRMTCARLAGFCLIYGGARLVHTYGLRIGRDFHINAGGYVDGRGGLTIGDHVMVGQNALIVSSQHQWTDPTLPMSLQGHIRKPTTIGDDVLVGAHAVVLAGVHVATGTVIAAGAVVTDDTEPYSIVGGVPARKIGERPRPGATQTAIEGASMPRRMQS